jgi:DNA polymerase-3 subunit delta
MARSSTERDVKGALAKGQAEPVYLLLGDDEKAKEPLLDAFAGLVGEGLEGFNLERFHGYEATPDDVVAAARTLPFLGGRRVVTYVRAEAALKPKKARGGDAVAEDEGGGGPVAEDALAPASLAALEDYLQKPSPDTCLVIVATDINRGSRIGKLLMAHATVVEFWGLRAGPDTRGGSLREALEAAYGFVRSRVQDQGMAIDEDAVERLLAHAGADVTVLRGDLERLLTFCEGRRRIELDDVRAVVGGAVSLDDWAVVNAIERQDAKRALRELDLMLDGGASPYAVLGQLGWFVRTKLPRLAPARVAGAVREVFETDLALKTSRGEPRGLLERLVVNLCGRE